MVVFVFGDADRGLMMKCTGGIWLYQIPLAEGYLAINRVGLIKYTFISY
jgi:hypothetical protein|tara:strand:- start:42 stop:188 length:147 start_codon:yes stop_codon:yes gene_type:complete